MLSTASTLLVTLSIMNLNGQNTFAQTEWQFRTPKACQASAEGIKTFPDFILTMYNKEHRVYIRDARCISK